MQKVRLDNNPVEYPGLGGKVVVPLASVDKRENFLLDVSRGRIELKKGTYQTRARHVIILVRLDFGGPTHVNPDGEEIPCPHLHVYREGYGAKWAVLLPEHAFPTQSDSWAMLGSFLAFCNITDPPAFTRGLFA